MSAMATLRGIALAASRLPQKMLVALVKAYRLLLSPWLGSSCRF
ncbi:MAG: membrane protein insertion efficiency factor YidD, partial [Burkholderiales bacterium]|nr:membrane protein insertion efficiency factor YidD [Burkholderiales bacterium]